MSTRRAAPSACSEVSAALVITIRESFEVSLLVGVVLALLDRGEDNRLRRAVWLGTGGAALASLALGFGLLTTVRDLHGRAREIVEAAVMWIAAGVLRAASPAGAASPPAR